MTENFGESLVKKLQAYIDQIPFVDPIQIAVLEAKEGFVLLRVKPRIDLFNHFHTYQAGSLFTLAEVAAGTLCGTFLDLSNHMMLTKRGEVDFVKATSEELFAEARLSGQEIQEALARLESQKKTDVWVPVVVRTSQNEVISQCRFCCYLRTGIPRSFLNSKNSQKIKKET